MYTTTESSSDQSIRAVATKLPNFSVAPPTALAYAATLTYNRMVVDQSVELSDATLDRVFHALADPTRRDILGRCARSDASVSEVAANYPISFAAVQKHVAVLERARLVTKRRRGREQLVSTESGRLADARRLLDDMEADWRGRVERMSSVLTTQPRSQPQPKHPTKGRVQ